MKLYILADRLNKSLDDIFQAIEKLNLNIDSPEQNLTHEEVMEITRYFAENKRFGFIFLLWGYILSFLSTFAILFKRRGYFYGVCTGIAIFTFIAIDSPNVSNETLEIANSESGNTNNATVTTTSSDEGAVILFTD